MATAGSARDPALRRAGRVLWYLRELTGEADYDRYLARHGREHPDPRRSPGGSSRSAGRTGPRSAAEQSRCC